MPVRALADARSGVFSGVDEGEVARARLRGVAVRAAVELDGGDVLSGGGGGVDGAAARAPRRAARGESAEEEEPSAKALGIAR